MARRRDNRGGPRTPANPAPVSGPGGLSQRTDGGPGQPVRSFPSQNYGQRKNLRQLQQAAPMAQAPGAPAGASPTQPPGRARTLNAFTPTERPNEPLTSGLPIGAGAGPRDAQASDDYLTVLQVMYSVLPHPEIARLLTVRRGGRRA